MIDIKIQEELKIYLEKYYKKPDTVIDNISELNEQNSCLKYNEDLTISKKTITKF